MEASIRSQPQELHAALVGALLSEGFSALLCSIIARREQVPRGEFGMEDEEKMQALYVPAYGDSLPRRIEIRKEHELWDLQKLVGGDVEPLDIYENTTIWCNAEGLYECIPNRAIFATPWQEEAGFLSQFDFKTPVKTGDFFTVLHGDLVVLGIDENSYGERSRGLTEPELKLYEHYFTEISRPLSGEFAILALQHGGKDEAARLRVPANAFKSLEDFGGRTSADMDIAPEEGHEEIDDSWLDGIDEEDRF